MSRKEHAQSLLPLGTMGSGHLSLDEQGRLHNHIMSPCGSGPLLSSTFPAIRVKAERGSVYMRALCVGPPARSRGGAAEASLWLDESHCNQRRQYPMATYQLADASAPVRVTWTYFSPIIPYDHVASVMPAVFLGLRVQNPTKQPLNCSVLFNFENTVSNPEAPHGLENIWRIRVNPGDERDNHFAANYFRGLIANASPETLAAYGFNALIIGERRKADAEASEHYCVAVKEQANSKLTLTIWDPNERRSYERFWQNFRETGQLPTVVEGITPRAGAVCSTIRLAPETSHRFDFLVSWHVPAALCAKRGAGNGYIQHFPDASSSAQYGVKHVSYLFSAVDVWHKRITGSGLPPAFSNALIAGSKPFTTHTRHAVSSGLDLGFCLGSEDDALSRWNFLTATALLIFAPRFHAVSLSKRLALVAQATEESFAGTDDETFREAAEIVLSAYADVVFAGNRARLLDWYAHVATLFSNAAKGALARVGDDAESLEWMSTQTLGLWVAAARAADRLAVERGTSSAVQRHRTLGELLSAAYKKRLRTVFEGDAVPTDTGQHADGNDCDATVLYGPCISELLDLGAIIPMAQIKDHLKHVATPKPEQGQNILQGFRAALITMMLKGLDCSGLEEQGRSLTALVRPVVEWQGQFFEGPCDTAKKRTRRYPDSLSLWTGLMAVTGFHYDTLRQALIIRPVLAEEPVTLPIFTPVSLGTLAISVQRSEEYILLVTIKVETPLNVQCITVVLPDAVDSVQATCEHNEELLALKQELRTEDGCNRVLITLASNLKLTHEFNLRLRGPLPRVTQ